MANKKLIELTEESNPPLTTSYVEITDNTDPLFPVTRRVSLRDLRGDGWAYYQDDGSGGAQAIADGSTVQLTVNGDGGSTNKTFLPVGVTDLWANDKITPENIGDCFMGRLDFEATPTGANVYFEISLDIGDPTPIVILNDVELFPKGSGVAQPFSLPLPLFSLVTFLGNGGKLALTAFGGSISVAEKALLVHRTYAAN